MRTLSDRIGLDALTHLSNLAQVSLHDIVYGFEGRLKELVESDPELFSEIGEAPLHAEEVGRYAAEVLVAPYRWRRTVGGVIDTTELAALLGVTRQAVASRVASGTLLALPGRSSRLYPTWQIDFEGRRVLPAVAGLLSEWRRIEPDVEALTVATWATRPNDLLDGRTPAELIKSDAAVAGVLQAARASADRRTR